MDSVQCVVLAWQSKGYLLKASEQAAAEKQPVIHVPTVDKAGNARQLRAAPIVCGYQKRKRGKKKQLPRGLSRFLIYPQ